jgi:hypothetical protein
MDKLCPKLSGACYVVRSMFHVSNSDTLKSVYFVYFHSIMKYGIFVRVIHLSAKRYSLYKGKLFD